jgi:type IV secretion system protein VirB1
MISGSARPFVGWVSAYASLALCATAHAQSPEQLLATCAPLVHPITMSKLVTVESRWHPFVIADAGPRGLPWKGVREKMVRSYSPASAEKAAQLASRLIAENHIVAIGLSQVSSQNLHRFGLTVEQVLDPCTNLHTGSIILTEFYLSARKTYPDPNQTVLAAISAYNTGNFISGFTNGYVGLVVNAPGLNVPALPAAYDSRLPANGYAPSSAGAPTYQRRRPQLLSQKLAVLNGAPE